MPDKQLFSRLYPISKSPKIYIRNRNIFHEAGNTESHTLDSRSGSNCIDNVDFLLHMGRNHHDRFSQVHRLADRFKSGGHDISEVMTPNRHSQTRWHIVTALALGVRIYTQEYDKIIIFTPIYPSFYAVVKDNNRQLICRP